MNVLNYLGKCIDNHPDKDAIKYKDKKISFIDLKEKSSKYGRLIFDNMDCNSKAIGVMCHRDIEPIVQFLGVVYSGNFYVPLDPESPIDRINSIIEDANIETILGTNEDQTLIDNMSFKGKFFTEEDLKEKLDSYIEPSDKRMPLYMVYTSGSTGKPKGVLKSHYAEISYIEAFTNTFNFDEDDIIGNQTPFYFDAAGKDIYLMLKKGITLDIIPTEYFPLPPQLIEYLNERKITFGSWVPTVLSIVSQLNPFSVIKPTTLKKIFFVGEVMPMKHLNTWRSEMPNLEYVNLYGQSELCGVCCYYKVEKEFNNDESLPIGKPLSNCKIYLLDEKENIITTPKKVGEMYIVSDALAIEYYNDEEKTTKTFIEKDFGNGKVRCFKTGDLAQYDDEFNLVFSSRSDYQIKHMGHRIELGEIETVAGSLSEINRCCCLYDNNKNKIVLFCQIANNIEISSQELKSILRTKLLSYMVPNKIIIMDNLPLNANGKIDRQKLKKVMEE